MKISNHIIQNTRTKSERKGSFFIFIKPRLSSDYKGRKRTIDAQRRIPLGQSFIFTKFSIWKFPSFWCLIFACVTTLNSLLCSHGGVIKRCAFYVPNRQCRQHCKVILVLYLRHLLVNMAYGNDQPVDYDVLNFTVLNFILLLPWNFI